MQSLVSLFTAAVLLAHAVLGCCWHHAHADEHGPDPAIELTATCCCHPEQPEQDQAPCESQCEGTCVYLESARVDFDLSAQAAAIDAIIDAQSLAVAGDSVSPNYVATSESRIGPPVRLHLFEQVLLI